MLDSTLFAVGNSPAPAINDATSAALVIGYTGSTGVSGGTGANIIKSYQSITDPTSSRAFFGTRTVRSNYIQITPSEDVIVITPTPTGSVSSNGRPNRIWIYITGANSFVEPLNACVFDVFMNSTTYSIGGVSIDTNEPYNSDFYITDTGTGLTGGCRHVRVTFYGSSFPTQVNSSRNRFAYIQSYSTNNNASAQLVWEYSSIDTIPDTGGIIAGAS
jgi:hypothetical protein